MKKKSKAAHELMRELQSNPEWLAQQREREKQWAAQEEADYREEAPIRADLLQVGCHVSSVWDLVNSSEAYPEAIPVLAKHLQQPHADGIREGIARALTCPEGRIAWQTLIEQFLREEDSTTVGVKWALANAISVLVDQENFDDVVPLVLDNKHGKNRKVIVEALKRIDHARVELALRDLTDDPDITDT